MDRLAKPQTFWLLAVGILLTLAVLPSTGWVARNALDNIQYGTEQAIQLGQFESVPKNLMDADRLTSNDPGTQLARALMKEDLNEMLRVAKAHPSAAWYAQAVRYSFLGASFSQQSSKDHGRSEKERARAEIGIQAAEDGAKLDPDNAFFPFSAAAQRWPLGDREGALADLERAAACSRYEDYVDQDASLRVRAVESRWGYRGETVRLTLEAETLLPQLSRYREFVRELCPALPGVKGLKPRLQVVETCGKMVEGAHTVIDILVVNAMCYNAETGIDTSHAKGDAKPGAPPEKRAAAQRQSALAFEALLKANDVLLGTPSPVAIQDRISRYAIAAGPALAAITDRQQAAISKGVGTPIIRICLIGMLGLLAASILSRAFAAMSEEIAQATHPFVIAFAALIWCLNQPPEVRNPNGMVLLFLLIPMAWSLCASKVSLSAEKAFKWVFGITLAGAVGWFLMAVTMGGLGFEVSDVLAFALGVLATFAATLLWRFASSGRLSARAIKVSFFLLAAALGLTAGNVADMAPALVFACGALATSVRVPVWIPYLLLGLLLAGMAYGALGADDPDVQALRVSLAYGCLLGVLAIAPTLGVRGWLGVSRVGFAFALVLLFNVADSVRINQRLGQITTQWLNEANSVRAQANGSKIDLSTEN